MKSIPAPMHLKLKRQSAYLRSRGHRTCIGRTGLSTRKLVHSYFACQLSEMLLCGATFLGCLRDWFDGRGLDIARSASHTSHPPLRDRRDRIKDLAERAFQISGRLLDGTVDPKDDRSVPYVKLVD